MRDEAMRAANRYIELLQEIQEAKQRLKNLNGERWQIFNSFARGEGVTWLESDDDYLRLALVLAGVTPDRRAMPSQKGGAFFEHLASLLTNALRRQCPQNRLHLEAEWRAGGSVAFEFRWDYYMSERPEDEQQREMDASYLAIMREALTRAGLEMHDYHEGAVGVRAWWTGSDDAYGREVYIIFQMPRPTPSTVRHYMEVGRGFVRCFEVLRQHFHDGAEAG